VAGEIETLDVVEPLPQHLARHAYDRLIMLSDGIFAIAATLLALELHPPAQWDGTLADLVRQSARPLFGYLFGFFVVAVFWISHRNIALTLTLLCLVAMVPGAAALLARYGPSRAIMAYFALAGAIGAVQLMLWVYAAYIRDLTHSDLGRAQRARLLVQTAIPTFVCSIALSANAAGMYNATWLPATIALPVLLLRRWLNRLDNS
jgi:uncharacterized membrane protein